MRAIFSVARNSSVHLFTINGVAISKLTLNINSISSSRENYALVTMNEL